MTTSRDPAACLSDDEIGALLAGEGRFDMGALRTHLEACDSCGALLALASGEERPDIGDGSVLLNRYRVLGELGRGATGVVFRVHDTKLRRNLAIKMLHSFDATAPLRLEREARILARLSHPAIVTVFDIGQASGHVCMVMELVEGSNLREWLRAGRSRPEIVRVFREAAEGLHAAHAAGVVHRDFKPENLLVGNDGHAKIVDLGLASSDLSLSTGVSVGSRDSMQITSVRHLTRTGCTVGTPAYMAPEQFDGRPADARSDQFAFAVSMWEALYGHHPFAADSLSELRTKLALPPARSLHVHMTDAHAAVLRRALAADPRHRFASMAVLATELGAPRGRPRVSAGTWGAATGSFVVTLGLIAAFARRPSAEPTFAPGIAHDVHPDAPSAPGAGAAGSASAREVVSAIGSSSGAAVPAGEGSALAAAGSLRARGEVAASPVVVAQSSAVRAGAGVARRPAVTPTAVGLRPPETVPLPPPLGRNGAPILN